MHDFEWLCTPTLIQGTIALEGAATGCRAGASDAAVCHIPLGKESPDSPAPGANFSLQKFGGCKGRVLMHPVVSFILGRLLNYDGAS